MGCWWTMKRAVFITQQQQTALRLSSIAVTRTIHVTYATKKLDADTTQSGLPINLTKKPYYAEAVDMS